MKIKSVNLETVCGIKSELPVHSLPEFVLAGKSNVGKSSFINSFIQRKAYAKTSSTPGKTRTINFYLVNEAFYLVDLPGYGYAATGPVEQEKWGRMINRYLESSEAIEEVIQLIDIRHEPGQHDRQMFDWLVHATGYEPIVIATKADKIKRSQLQKQLAMLRRELGASQSCTILPFSALDKQGLDRIYALLEPLAQPEASAQAQPETKAQTAVSRALL